MAASFCFGNEGLSLRSTIISVNGSDDLLPMESGMTAKDKKPETEHGALKKFLGVDAIVSAVKNNYDPMKDGGKQTLGLLQRFFGKADGETYEVSSDSSDPFVRFADSLKDGNVSEKELAWRIRFSARIFNAVITCLGLIVAAIIIHPPSLHGNMMIAFMYSVIAVSGFSVLLAVLIQWGFFNYQLRHRALFKVGTYLRSPSEWFPSFTEVAQSSKPKPPSGRGGRGSIAAMALIVGLTGAFSSIAPAAAATITAASNDTCSLGNGYVLDTFSLPCQTDLFRNALEVIFPDVGPLTAQTITMGVNGYSENTNGQSAVAEAFMAFICVLFFVGASTLIWHTITLIVNVSQEGAAIHQRWSGVWTTSRLFFGASLLTPYVKGYCLANVLVLYAALWSGSLGNIIYNAYLSGLTQPHISSTATLPGITPTLQRLVDHDLCYNIIKLQNKRAQEAGTQPANSGVADTLAAPTQSSAATDTRAIGYKTMLTNLINPYGASALNYATLGLAGTSGGLSGANAAAVDAQTYSTWDFGGPCQSVSVMTSNPSGTSSPFGVYGKAEVDALNEFVQTMDKSISTVIDKEIGQDTAISSDSTADMAQIGKDYSDATAKVYSKMSSAAYTLLNTANSGGMQSLVDGAKKYGWATSGAFYMNFSRMQGLFDEFLAKSPEADPRYSYTQSASIQAYESTFGAKLANDGAYLDFYRKALNTVSNISTSTITDGAVAADLTSGSSGGSFYNLNINTNTTGLADTKSTIGEIVSWIGNGLGHFAQSLISSFTGSGTVDGTGGEGASGGPNTNNAPGSELEKMTEFGQNVLALAYTVIIIMGTGSVAVIAGSKFLPLGKAASAALWAADKSGLVGGMIGRMMGVLMWVLGGLLVIGATHAYILPMMPYIQVLMFILSMITMVMEAMIAAPIWALMHFRLDGQAFVGEHQRAGYMIMFNMFLRIPIAMLGMLLSVSVFNATILVMSVTFYPAVQSATASSDGSGFLGSMIMLGMMTYLHYQVAIRSFSLVSTVPGQVGRWFGASDAADPGQGVMQGVSGFLVGQATSGSSALLQNALGAKDNQQNGAKRTPPSTTGGNGAEPTSQVSSSGGGASSEANSDDSAVDGGTGGSAGNTESTTPASGVAENMGWSEAVSSVRGNSANSAAVANLGGNGAAGNLMKSIRQEVGGQSASMAQSSGSLQRGIDNYFANEGINPTADARSAASQLAQDAMRQWSDLNGDAPITG